MCTFRASCCIARLSEAGKKRGEGVRGDRLHWRVQRAVRPESVAGGGRFEVLWNLECSVGLSEREICAHFNEGNLALFGRSAENKELWSYVVKFEFSRPNSSSDRT